MATQVNYPTKPLDCWKKGKELRAEHYISIARAKEQGKLLVCGCAEGPVTLLAGLGPYEFFAGEPYGAAVSADHEFSLKAMEACEAKGYPRDLCAYARNHLGSMFLDKYYFTGGPFPKMDFLWSMRHCPCGHPMWHEIISRYQGVPYFAVDDECQLFHYGDMEQRMEYFAGQLLDCIEWMEKVTGRTYDVEQAAAAMTRMFEGEVIWGEINLIIGGAVPSPINLNTAMSLLSVHQLRRGEQCSVDFLKEYRDEIKDRIAKGIAGAANERFRICAVSIPPWPFLRYMKQLESLGVIHVGLSTYIYWGQVTYLPDGKVVPAKTPKEMGWPEVKTREDLVRTYARWRMHYRNMFVADEIEQRERVIKLVKHCKVSAATICLDRGCKPSNRFVLGEKHALEKAGIPTLMFEANRADIRDIDQTALIDRMEAFLESLGAIKK